MSYEIIILEIMTVLHRFSNVPGLQINAFEMSTDIAKLSWKMVGPIFLSSHYVISIISLLGQNIAPPDKFLKQVSDISKICHHNDSSVCFT